MADQLTAILLDHYHKVCDTYPERAIKHRDEGRFLELMAEHNSRMDPTLGPAGKSLATIRLADATIEFMHGNLKTVRHTRPSQEQFAR